MLFDISISLKSTFPTQIAVERRGAGVLAPNQGWVVILVEDSYDRESGMPE